MDPQLIVKAQNGDTAAFGQIYDDFAGRIFRFVCLKVNSREQAEDILQDVFVKAWQALPQFDPQKGHLSAWLYKIALNATNDFYRKAFRRPQAVELNPETDAVFISSNEDEIARQSDIQEIKKNLALLPVAYRMVLELRFIQDFTIKETAEALGKTQLAVRLSQHRALKKLRELINNNHKK